MTTNVHSVSVASNVLLRLVQMAVREVPGVARLGHAPARKQTGTHTAEGLVLRTGTDAAISADCYLVAADGTNLHELGLAVQATVTAIVQHLAGMHVREVNVTIQDVEINRG